MVENSARYPLHWPDNWPRTRNRKAGKMRVQLVKAIQNVRNSLRLFATDSGHEVTELLFSSNHTLGCGDLEDPGVAMYFKWRNVDTCIAVDRYHLLPHNVQAIHLCLEADRTKLRHGGIHLIETQYRGFAALPPPENGKGVLLFQDWFRILGCDQNAPLAAIRRAYLKQLEIHHPDKGGDTENCALVNAAWEYAQRRFEDSNHG